MPGRTVRMSDVRSWLLTFFAGPHAVPDRRKHRGPHPQDESLFAPERWTQLKSATSHLSWLLSRGYKIGSSLKLVGDRFELDTRQRLAVRRGACSDQSLRRRLAGRIPTRLLGGEELAFDGFNLLTTVEAALSGGVLLRCRDGCLRDMASMQGSYRKVAETLPALELIGRTLEMLQPAVCTWWLDRPVSNSGRVGQLIRGVAAREGWPWQTQIVADPDPVLREASAIVVTADSAILDACHRWTDLASAVVARLDSPVWLVPLAA